MRKIFLFLILSCQVSFASCHENNINNRKITITTNDTNAINVVTIVENAENYTSKEYLSVIFRIKSRDIDLLPENVMCKQFTSLENILMIFMKMDMNYIQ